ncbi:MAG: hypothetical protein IJY61_01670 [Candidatus Gastranaerophilales bacterium]|nr:hypothetical protein [Candidatus Gastranaerophilales bacterium]
MNNIFSFNYNRLNEINREFIVDRHYFTNYKKPEIGDPIYFTNDGRSLVGEEYTKRPILLLGDSYTYGLGLEKEQTFGYKLSHKTKRPVHNWGFSTEGVEYALFLLNEKQNIDLFKNNFPEFIIFTYTYPQPERVLLKHRFYRWYYLRKFFDLNNQHYSEFDRLYSVLTIRNHLYYNYLISENTEEKVLSHIQDIFIELAKIIKLKFKDAKFIILIYSDTKENIIKKGLYHSNMDIDFLEMIHWKKLKKENKENIFSVVSTEELIGRKMNKIEDIIENEKTITIHPSEKAWDEIVPKLIKKYKM